jgi:hypothetical protein
MSRRTPSAVDQAAFQAQAGRIARTFAESDPPIRPLGPDPSGLLAITEEISELMQAQEQVVILSAGPGLARDVVTVGVTDLDAPEVTALVAKYGGKVSVFEDDPVELRPRSVS